MDILLFLLCIGILIFAEKITDHHHAYNWRNITKINPRDGILSISMRIIDAVKLSIFTCRILDTWRSIVLAIKKSNYLYCNVLSNKFQAEWNVMKMNRSGEYESEIRLH